MDNFIKLTEFDIKINQKVVFQLMDCHRDSPIYEELSEEYERLEPEILRCVHPVAYLKFGTYTREGKGEVPALYVLTSIGDEVTELSDGYFGTGDYLLGMLTNSMSDAYMFQLETQLHERIKEECILRGFGIAEKLEAPVHIPMEEQERILEEIKAVDPISIELTKGYMFTTVKTLGHILVLTEDITVDHDGHNCDECDRTDCKMRKGKIITVTVLGRGAAVQLPYERKTDLLKALVAKGIYVSAACGGKGTCGKCKIKVVSGELEVTDADRAKFNEKELEQGYRLACKAYPESACTIRIVSGDEADFEVVTEIGQGISLSDGQEKTAGREEMPNREQMSGRMEKPGQGEESSQAQEGYALAIDIGTTTIAISLVNLATKQIIRTYTTINKQRAYGADIISRIKASVEGKKEELRQSIRTDLLEGIRSIVEGSRVDKDSISEIAIAANTTMVHLLLGYSCETLGVYPFTPVNIDRITLSFAEMFGEDYLAAPVTVLPGISTFVGGDIVAGLLTCGFDKMEEPSLLIDLGTNGEMAIGNKDRILVTSTAAGPAFEGGNISCGVGSVAGAICNVRIGDTLVYDTIGQKPPIGICGTGVIELTSELLKTGLIDETGLLCDEYFDSGYVLARDDHGNDITFTQRDIRELQMAKSAVRAGVETLMKRYGVTCGEIGKVYLAGGFGYKVNLEKAIHIGLLPEELDGKITAIGNSSLSGALHYLVEEDAPERMERMKSLSKEVHLSNDVDFNDLYIEFMAFGEEE
ncbi:MAG TPA: DUF4445 domain-containing protein [Clostridiales bacterium]|nr:DUF4445 domain-containing protein [Clostridiales bacterium]